MVFKCFVKLFALLLRVALLLRDGWMDAVMR